MKKRRRKFSTAMRRAERKVLVAWIRFAHRHKHSHRLPTLLFFLFFIDGFIMIIPSIICLIAAVTISPKRWFLFGSLAVIAATLNNMTTYFLGRLLPAGSLENLIEIAGLTGMWEKANAALHHYGSFAVFFGAIFGLPTQMITALIGISDSKILRSGLEFHSTFVHVFLFLFLGHAAKSLTFAALTRFGWVKLEKKFQKSNP